MLQSSQLSTAVARRLKQVSQTYIRDIYSRTSRKWPPEIGRVSGRLLEKVAYSESDCRTCFQEENSFSFLEWMYYKYMQFLGYNVNPCCFLKVRLIDLVSSVVHTASTKIRPRLFKRWIAPSTFWTTEPRPFYQVIPWRGTKQREILKPSSLKVVAVAYERWSFTKLKVQL